MRLISTGMLALAALLTACGGDGTGSNPPVNNPPSFGTARLDVNYAENGTGPITTLTISDEASANLVIRISGADGALFTVDASRVVRFNAPPDFETPRDQGANNVYNFTVTATDNIGSSAVVEINITVTNDATAGLRYVDPVFPTTTDLGTMAIAGSGFELGLVGPAGDTLSNRPLMLLAPGSSAASVPVLADGFARRGYVVGVLSGPAGDYNASASGLVAALEQLTSPSFDARGYGIDSGALFVAGEGFAGRAASLIGMAGGGSGPVRGAFSLSSGAFDPGRATGSSAVLFSADGAQQGAMLAEAYRASGVPMQFMQTGSAMLTNNERETAIAGAAQLFHAQILARRGQ